MELLVVLEPELGTDPDESERLSRQLRAELRRLDIDSLSTATPAAAPPDAKGDEAFTFGAWILTLSASGGVFATVVETIQYWMGRHTGEHRISLTINGDKLELDNASTGERSDLIDAFVRRHAGS